MERDTYIGGMPYLSSTLLPACWAADSSGGHPVTGLKPLATGLHPLFRRFNKCFQTSQIGVTIMTWLPPHAISYEDARLSQPSLQLSSPPIIPGCLAYCHHHLLHAWTIAPYCNRPLKVEIHRSTVSIWPYHQSPSVSNNLKIPTNYLISQYCHTKTNTI